jgi:hypothetical protein
MAASPYRRIHAMHVAVTVERVQKIGHVLERRPAEFAMVLRQTANPGRRPGASG